MYLEFIAVFIDYARFVNKKSLFFEIITPTLIGIVCFAFFFRFGLPEALLNFNDSVVKLFSVLAGFSTTIITILSTGNSVFLKRMKIHEPINIDSSGDFSVYRYLMANYTYSIIIELFTILTVLFVPFILEHIELPFIVKIMVYSLFITCVTHVLLLTIRNITDFYLIVTANQSDREVSA